MPEKDFFARSATPLTVTSLTEQLRACGLAEGQTVLVHMAMSKLGWIIGGAEAVILALLAAVGESGTIMMPAYSRGMEPSNAQHPPIPEKWWQTIRDHTPAYNPLTTPTSEIGVVPELFRTWPGTVRSAHPAFSLAAHGPNAEYLVADHALNQLAGDQSPFGKLYELDGHVLLLGVEHWDNSSLHLAEFRVTFPSKSEDPTGNAMLVNGERQWVTYAVSEENPDDFGEIGAAFDAAHNITAWQINNAEVRFFRQRQVIEFAVEWIKEHRDGWG